MKRTTNRPGATPAPSAEKASPTEKSVRLHRFLASGGCGSRRHCETLIAEGRVEVDGEIVTHLGTKIDPTRQHVTLDGEAVRAKRLQYFAVHKPPGVVSTSNDPSGRPRVIDLVASDQRLFNVGRLDKSSEGLILVTNDGELAQKLTHPKYGIEKRYLVLVAGHLQPEALRQLERGVHLAEGVAKASRAEMKKKTPTGTWIEIELREGRNREIRRLLARIGHKVTRLIRIAIGPVLLGDLPPGDHRQLARSEIERLQRWRPRPAARPAVRKPRRSGRAGPSGKAKLARPKSSAKRAPRGRRGPSRS